MGKFSKSIKKIAAIAAVTSTFVTLPVLAQNMPAADDMKTQPQVEMEPMKPSDSMMSPESGATTTSGSIVDVAASNGSFTILTTALKATGLDKDLASGGPYTVFAPTDEAFAALPEGTLEELLKPENRETLVSILTYHVVPGENTSSMLQSGDAETVEGRAVKLDVSSSGVMVNDARVVQPDIEASNGVIHVIDKVIIPPDA